MTDDELREAAGKLLGFHGLGLVCWEPELQEGHMHGPPDFDPLNKIQDAWLLVEKMRGMSSVRQLTFDERLWDLFLRSPERAQHATPISFTVWLTPRHITVAAVEAVGKEKG